MGSCADDYTANGFVPFVRFAEIPHRATKLAQWLLTCYEDSRFSAAYLKAQQLKQESGPAHIVFKTRERCEQAIRTRVVERDISGELAPMYANKLVAVGMGTPPDDLAYLAYYFGRALLRCGNYWLTDSVANQYECLRRESDGKYILAHRVTWPDPVPGLAGAQFMDIYASDAQIPDNYAVYDENGRVAFLFPDKSASGNYTIHGRRLPSYEFTSAPESRFPAAAPLS